MKRKKLVVLWTLTIGFIFISAHFLEAGTVRRAAGTFKVSLSFKLKDSDKIIQTKWIIFDGRVLERSGRYMQKRSRYRARNLSKGVHIAKKKAVQAAMQAMGRVFEGKFDEQIAYIKKMKETLLEKYPEIKNSEWIRIDKFKLIAYSIKDGIDSKYSRFHKIAVPETTFILIFK